MQITNQNQTPIPRRDTSTSAAPTPLGSAASPAAAPSSDPLQVSSLVPSFEFLSLTTALQQLPSIRPEVVAATIQRLASGHLLSPAALEATAQAMLDQ